MRGTTVDAADVLGEVNTFLSRDTRVEQRTATAAETQSATTLNRNGETAYRNGDLEGAVNLFRQAIDIDSNFGQAYSNLGLTYQKLGRTSEAIWANRKAIALARGNTAPTVRASSYYNIARIYEAAGQFSDALTNYQSANSEKENPVYTQAIDRVRAQIH
jgi:Flp pilus assembly protein TadD